MKILVGSKNESKVSAVKLACQQLQFPNESISGVHVESGVSVQPFSDEETVAGAINRAELALADYDGQLAFGLEGGLFTLNKDLYVCNWGALKARNLSKAIVAGGARFKLPNIVAEQVLQGQELGVVMEEYAGELNVGQGSGAIGILTNNILNRSEMYSQIIKILLGQYLFEIRRRGGEIDGRNSP